MHAGICFHFLSLLNLWILHFKALICINKLFCRSLNKNWLDLTWLVSGRSGAHMHATAIVTRADIKQEKNAICSKYHCFCESFEFYICLILPEILWKRHGTTHLPACLVKVWIKTFPCIWVNSWLLKEFLACVTSWFWGSLPIARFLNSEGSKNQTNYPITSRKFNIA